MAVEEFIKYINDKIDDINKKYPNSISNEQKENYIKSNVNTNMTPEEIEKKKIEVDSIAEEYVKTMQQQIEYLNQMSKKFNDTDYQLRNIDNIDISTLDYDQIERMFFHYSWKKFLELYDKKGIEPDIGENSDGIDFEPSIFFSKGLEGVLELWDVWLKWRLNRQNNPQYKGNDLDEIKATSERFKSGNISEEEKQNWYYWMDYLKEKRYLYNNEMLKKLFEYQYNEMINSVYFIMDLRENDEFIYNQIDVKKQMAIENSKKTGRGIDSLTFAQYGTYSDFSNPIVDKWNMQTIPGKQMTIEPSRIKMVNVKGNTDVYSIVKFMYDKYKKEIPLEKQVKFDILDKYITYVEDKKKNNMKKQPNDNQKIGLTPTLLEIFNNIERDSKFSSSELVRYYLSMSEYQQMYNDMKIQSNKIEEQICQLRKQNSQMSDNDFFKTTINNYSKQIIEIIKKDYKDKLTPKIIERLDNFNISIINNSEVHGDMTAHPEKSMVEINEAYFATDVKDIESKITRAMATIPHEIFHFIFRILKDENHCDERMVYNLVDGSQATCLGMIGHMLNEGIVEKFSTDFCKRNNIYTTINPSYIQFVNLCNYIIKTNPEINESFLIQNNYEGILNKFSSEVKDKYKETERIEYLRNFKLKTTSGERRKIEDSEVVNSYNESVQPKYIEQPNETLQSVKDEKSSEDLHSTNNKKLKPFSQRSQIEQEIYQQIKQKNQKIKQQKKQLNKPKVKVLSTQENVSNNNKGYTNVILLSIIVSFVCGTLFMIVYMIIGR